MGVIRRGSRAALRGLGRLLIWYVALCAALAAGSVFLTRSCADLVAGGAAFDTVLVLGAANRAPGELGPASALRIDAAIALVEAGAARRIVTSGYSGLEGPSVAEVMAARARAALDPDPPILVEAESRSTLENALFSAPLLQGRGVVVVSQDFHLLRARASLVWAGVTPAATCHPETGLAPGVRARAALRETLAWGWNIPRAAIWSAARALGREDTLPAGFLH